MKKLSTILALFLLCGLGYATTTKTTSTAKTTSSFIFEDFTSPVTPAGWTYSNYVRQETGGINNSPAIRGNIWPSVRNAVVTTGYVTMGSSPVLSFWYKVNGWDTENPNAPADANTFEYKVELTEDGNTWHTVLAVGPNATAPSATTYEQVTVNVSAYANKTCMARITFTSTPAGDLFCWIDDVTVGTLSTDPVFEGLATFNLGTIFNNIPNLPVNYNFSNKGGADLTISSVISASPELTVGGTPITVAPLAGGVIPVSINASALPTGVYSGNFVIATNMPSNPEVTVNVTANVTQALIRSFIFENFSGNAIPQGWTYSRFNRVFSGGIGNSPALQAMLYDDEMSSNRHANVKTSYVMMGANPVVSFNYKMENYGVGTPADTDAFSYRVLITQDYGVTWQTVLDVAPGDAVTQDGTYKLVTVPTANLTAYAGKTCMVQIAFSSNHLVNGDVYAWLDDVTVGTLPQNELEAVSIAGTQTPKIGTPATYTVVVKNNGFITQNSSTYSVNLMQGDGTQVATLPGVTIAHNEVKSFVFTWTPTVEGPTYLYGVVDFSADEFVGNNTTSNLNVNVQPASTTAINIGRANATSNFPVNFYYTHSLSQTLYYPHELKTNSGLISSLSYTANFVADRGDRNVAFWVGETTLEDLSTGWVDPATLTQVFSGTINFPGGVGKEIVIPFSAPYAYKGGTLVVYAYRWDTQYTSQNDVFATSTSPGLRRTRGMAGDAADAFDPANPNLEHSVPFAAFPDITVMVNTSGTGSLSGMVGSISYDMLEGVKLQIVGTQLYVMTDAGGNFSFPYLTPGNYEMEITKFGFDAQTIPFTITADANATQYVFLTPWTTYTVGGKVIGNDEPNGLEDVEITLSATIQGTSVAYTGTSNATGNFSIAGIFGNQTYNVEAKLAGRQKFTGTVDVATTNYTDLNITLNEITRPVINPTAAVQGNNAVVTWRSPNDFEEETYILDDGTAEEGIIASPVNSLRASFGNKFMVGETGVLTSIDIFARNNNSHSSRQTWVEIYDANRNLVGSSQFTFLSNDWVNVPLEDIPYSGIFYAMVTWAAATGETHWLGVDENGPNVDGDHGWFRHNTGDWVQVPGPGGGVVYMIRANANVEGLVKSTTYGDNNHKTQVSAGDITDAFARMESSNTVDAQALYVAPKTLVDYNVYRLIEGAAEGTWTQLANNISALTYTDNSWSALPNGVYQYAIKANYTGGLQSPARLTNTLQMGNVSIVVKEREIFTVSPNPVHDLLHIQTEKTIRQIEIIDLMGRVLKTWMGDNKTINVQAIPAGNYIIRIHTDNAIVPIRIVKQ
jgi:hypothetical protein